MNKASSKKRQNPEKALAQAQKKIQTLERKAQIEAALERVRSRAMAMHHSDELAEAASVVFEQLHALDVTPWRCAFCFFDEKDSTIELWATTSEGVVIPRSTTLPIKGHPYPYLEKMYAGWKKQQPWHSFEVDRPGWFKYMAKQFGFAESEMKSLQDQTPENRLTYNGFCFLHGVLVVNTLAPLDGQDAHIIQRFAKVFEQTHTRFLDLKQAEEQAREAQIEAALERVRAASLAMHRSDELQNLINVIFEQIVDLGIQANSCSLNIYKERSRDFNAWIATPEDDYPQKIHVPYLNSAVFNRLMDARRSGKKFLADSLSGKVIRRYLEHAFTNSDLRIASKNRRRFLRSIPGMHRSTAFTKHAALTIANYGLTPFE